MWSIHTTPLQPSQSSEEPAEQSAASLLSQLDFARRRWWLIVICAAVAVGVGAVRTVRQPKIYRATATVLIADRPPARLDKVTATVANADVMSSERFLNAQIGLLSSRAVADRTASLLSMPEGSLVGRLIVDIDKRSQIAALSVESADPKEAQTLANAFMDVYEEFTASDRTSQAVDAEHFLDKQARTLRARVEADEKQLFDFLKSHELAGSNFEDSNKIQSADIGAFHTHWVQAQNEGITLKSQLSELEAARGDPDKLRAIAGSVDSRLSALKEQRNTLLDQVISFESRYGANHPKLIEAKERLSSVEKELQRDLDGAIVGLQARVHANEKEQTQLRAVIQNEAKMAAVTRQSEVEYNKIKRRLDEDRASYNFATTNQSETELQSVMRQSYVRKLDAAILPTTPVRPDMRANLAAALMLGIALGVALAFMLELMQDSFRSIDDAERSLKEPMLGLVQNIALPDNLEPHALELARAEHIVKNPRSPAAEQLHQVTTNLFSQFLEKPPRAIMVTSASMEEGKTLVAMNLATTIAGRGKRVLVIDCDLRRGRLHKLFKMSRRGGMFELLTQRLTLDEAIRKTWAPNVDVILTGDVPAQVSPLRLFELKNFPAVVDELKSRYDLIVFDTAPVGLVSDALLIGGVVDGAVGVLRAERTSRRAARNIAKQLRHNRIPFIGWILNDVRESELRSAHRYGYGYGYGYYPRAHSEDGPPA